MLLAAEYWPISVVKHGETPRKTTFCEHLKTKHPLQWEQRERYDTPSAETKVFYVARRQSKGLQASKAPKICHFR